MTTYRYAFGRAPLPSLITICLLLFCLVGPPIGNARGEIDVWIDPGHGGSQSGTRGFDGPDFPNEKDITLPIANRAESRLFELGFFCVHKTRNSDRKVTVQNRAKIANGELANDEMPPFQDTARLFVSVHLNDWVPSRFGTETYYSTIKPAGYDKKAKQADINAATKIQADLMTAADVAFGPTCSDDRGVMQNNYYVLAFTASPAVLVEVCFLTNACQYNRIIQLSWQNYLGEGIASGISKYLVFGYCFPVGEGPDRSPYAPAAVQQTAVPVVDGLASGTIVTSLVEDFESATFPPAGWTSFTAGLAPPHGWHRTTDPDFIGFGSASAFVGSQSPSAIDEWLVSPPLALSAPDDAIRFQWSGSKYWSAAINATLSIREVGTATWTQLWSLAADEPSSEPFIYRERVVDLVAWTGMNVELGFRVVGTHGASFGLDDVAVGDFTPTGTAPNDVCAGASVLPDVFSVQGVTCYAANDLDPYVDDESSCVEEQLGGADVFYEITAAWGETLHASVSAEWNAGLYLVDDCLTPVCAVGAFPQDGRTQSSIAHRFAPGGTYYLVVDGAEGSCGPFTLTGEIVASPTGVQPRRTPGLQLAARPNPADGPVRLFGTFASSPGAKTVLEIFDVAGRRLQRYEGRADSGELSFVWDHRDQTGRRVASGLYFARLRVGDESVVQKFVIVR